jgi:DNA-binding transcriptional MerR regulator
MATDGGDLLTIDELSLATGLTVRTTRYYASLGLLPPPLRRGRMAYYGQQHLARLTLVRALQDHGFTLAAIEKHLAGIPLDASPEDLSVQRALLTAWTPGRWETVTRAELDVRAGRALDDADLRWLTRAGLVRQRAEELQALPLLRLAVELKDLDLPVAALVDADAAVRRHMAQLADELTEVMEKHVMGRYRSGHLSHEDAETFESTIPRLRRLTLEAIVNAFQAAAQQLVTRSLSVEQDDRPTAD